MAYPHILFPPAFGTIQRFRKVRGNIYLKKERFILFATEIKEKRLEKS